MEYKCKTATESMDKVYRYELVRQWDYQKPTCVYVMLNPSSADGFADDPTIKRCVSLADSNGFGSIIVYNLFAYRTKDPWRVRLVHDPIGPCGNTQFQELNPEWTIICAWGGNGYYLGRDKAVLALLKDHKLFCFGQNKDGSPKHPLYLPRASKLEVYEERSYAK